MPELPEVETVRRAIDAALVGASVADARILHPRTARRQARPSDVRDRLIGRRVRAIERVGKFLLIGLDSDLTWVVHLGMSGRILLLPLEAPPDRHTRFRAEMASGDSVRFIDPRTFGFVAVFTPAELAESTISRLGPDVWRRLPSPRCLAEKMKGRSVAVKTLLLDQRFVAGLGNIYADEVLHRAGIDPSRPAGDLSEQEVKKLRSRIRPVLSEAIARGGTSLADLAYLLPDGRAGENLRYLRVYGREGRPCRSCGAPIRRTVISARSSFHCPSCQPPPEGNNH